MATQDPQGKCNSATYGIGAPTYKLAKHFAVELNDLERVIGGCIKAQKNLSRRTTTCIR
jgi:hypothetical protein